VVLEPLDKVIMVVLLPLIMNLLKMILIQYHMELLVVVELAQ
jgi:hypothetical protein